MVGYWVVHYDVRYFELSEYAIYIICCFLLNQSSIAVFVKPSIILPYLKLYEALCSPNEINFRRKYMEIYAILFALL